MFLGLKQVVNFLKWKSTECIIIYIYLIPFGLRRKKIRIEGLRQKIQEKTGLDCDLAAA